MDGGEEKGAVAAGGGGKRAETTYMLKGATSTFSTTPMKCMEKLLKDAAQAVADGSSSEASMLLRRLKVHR